MADTAERIKQLEDNINTACTRCGRQREDVKLIIVTKSASLEKIKEVIELGFRDFGENRVQQLKSVAAELDSYLKICGNNEPINWHMIGHLQRNKVRQILPITSLVHSVDTLRLAEEINISAGKLNLIANVLLQVNSSKEPQKYGVPVGAAVHLAEQMVTLPNIKLIGLMTMAPLTRNESVIRSCFERTRELFVEISGEKVVGPEFCELSMGMSSDYEMAIEEGATLLRIGSAVFAG